MTPYLRPHLIERVISGGQTGADQAGWRAARAHGIATGGWMPRGFLTEDGNHPELAVLFGAAEMPTADYPARTRRNAEVADVTLWFGATSSPGARTTLAACRQLGRPYLHIEPGQAIRPSVVAACLKERRPRIVNIAGNRESGSPGIGNRVERFLRTVFEQLGHAAVPSEPPASST